MKTIMINNQAVPMQTMLEDVITCASQGFTGHGKFTAQAVMEMIKMLNHSSMQINENVPVDYENPNWNGKNRVYEWKNYITQEVSEIWNKFPHSQKVLLASEAHKKAMNECWE